MCSDAAKTDDLFNLPLAPSIASSSVLPENKPLSVTYCNAEVPMFTSTRVLPQTTLPIPHKLDSVAIIYGCVIASLILTIVLILAIILVGCAYKHKYLKYPNQKQSEDNNISMSSQERRGRYGD